MTPQELAARLHGCQYREEMGRELEAQARAAGLLVVFGGSDDLVELRGAIHDEVGVGEGSLVYLDEAGLLPDYTRLVLDGDRHGGKARLREYFRREPGMRAIQVHWENLGYAWTYETSITHAVFDVMDEEETYCRGMVIKMADIMLAPAQPPL